MKLFNLKWQKSLLFLFFSLMFSSIQAGELTTEEKDTVSKLFNLRLETALASNPDIALKKVYDMKKTIDTSNFSKEMKLAVENLLVWQEFNCIYDKNMNDSRLEKLIMNQKTKNTAYFNENGETVKNPWLLYSSAQVHSTSFAYCSVSKILSEGTSVKDNYLKALEFAPNNADILINLGTWYYFAPAIGGGSKSKAKSYFEKALANARTKSEIFSAKVYLGQIYYEEGNKEKCNAYMNDIASYSNDSYYIKKLKKLNEAGYSYFDYIENKEKLDKKLAL